MDRKTKDEMVEIVTDAIGDVVIPAMEDVEDRLRKDMRSMEDRLREDLSSKTSVDRIERKVDAIQDRLDRQNQILEKHDTDIKKLQLAVS